MSAEEESASIANWLRSKAGGGVTALDLLHVADVLDDFERLRADVAALEAAQGVLIDACGLALNYHQEPHVYEALRSAITRAIG